MPRPSRRATRRAASTPRDKAPASTTASDGMRPAVAQLGATVAAPLRTLEAARGRPLLAYYLGDGLLLHDAQMLHLYEHLRRLGRQPRLDLWLYSRGGSTEVPWKVISLLREYTEELAVLVPYRATSAATHIAMGADAIVMTPLSELGPVDPSRRHPLLPVVDGRPIEASVQELAHVVAFVEERSAETLSADAVAELAGALFDHIHPLAIGAMEQSRALAEQISRKVLATHMDADHSAEEIERIASAVGDGFKSHQYPISRAEARDLGLKVVAAQPEEDRAMWDLLRVLQTQIRVEAKAEIGGKPATLEAYGALVSRAGTSLGMGLRLADSSERHQRWESAWSMDPH